jgi:hypothetical protein
MAILSQLLVVSLSALHHHDHLAAERQHHHVAIDAASAADHAADCATCHLISISRSGFDVSLAHAAPDPRLVRLHHLPPTAQPPARRVVTLASPRAPPMA